MKLPKDYDILFTWKCWNRFQKITHPVSPEKSQEDTDKHNLLLPSERFDILNNTLIQLVNMRMAVRAVNARLSVDFTWQKAVEYAVNFKSYIGEARSRAFNTFAVDVANRPLP